MAEYTAIHGVLTMAGIRKPKIRKSLGPFAYERDEYRFWHRFYVGSWRFSFCPDPVAPAFSVTLGEKGEWRLEVTWVPTSCPHDLESARSLLLKQARRAPLPRQGW